jgi:hypothetical protein
MSAKLQGLQRPLAQIGAVTGHALESVHIGRRSGVMSTALPSPGHINVHIPRSPASAPADRISSGIVHAGDGTHPAMSAGIGTRSCHRLHPLNGATATRSSKLVNRLIGGPLRRSSPFADARPSVKPRALRLRLCRPSSSATSRSRKECRRRRRRPTLARKTTPATCLCSLGM